jgi:hypothetical protein
MKHYTNKDLYVNKTEKMGFGLFTNETIKKDEKVFRFNLKKVIRATSEINFGIFFTNTLML